MEYDPKGPLPEDLWLAVCEDAEVLSQNPSREEALDHLNDLLHHKLYPALKDIVATSLLNCAPPQETTFYSLKLSKFYITVRDRYKGRKNELHGHFDTPKGNQVDEYITEYLTDI